MLRRVVAVGGLVQHRVADSEGLPTALVVRAAAGDAVFRHVPGLHGCRKTLRPALAKLDRLGREAFLDPRLGFVHQLVCRHDLVDDAGGLRLFRRQGLALQDQRQGGCGADHARQALGAATAGQQADLGFRQAELGLGVVGHKARVAGQRHFKAAAERRAGDGSRNRLAAGFHAAQLHVEGDVAFIHGLHLVLFGPAASATAGIGPHHGQISTGAERTLAGGEHEALDGIVRCHLLDDVGEVLHGGLAQHVH